MSGEALKYEGALLEPASAESLLRLKNRIKRMVQSENMPDNDGNYSAKYRFIDADKRLDFDMFYSSRLTECEECEETYKIEVKRIADLTSLGKSDKEVAYSYGISVVKSDESDTDEIALIIDQDTKMLSEFENRPEFKNLANEIFNILLYSLTPMKIKEEDTEDSKRLETALKNPRLKANEILVLNLLAQLQEAARIHNSS